MRPLDWTIFGLYLVSIIGFGAWQGRRSRGTEDYFLAGRRVAWWAIGLSVMATQASAITFIGTTGKAYEDGMKFLQFYFGLPVAMVILCVTLVPLFYRAKVYTAYEYLEQRFDAKTRLLSSILFLLSRGLALGVVVYAPSVVLSILLGWSIGATVLVMASAAVIYTVIGGIRAVIWTDVMQMGLIFFGMVLCFGLMISKLPGDVSLVDAVYLAGVSEHMRSIDFSFDPNSKYTVWSGLIGGTFLFLAYFGCDQSQAQRYLTSRSLTDSRLSLLFNAFLKVPMQFFILFLGVLLFVFYQFDKPPMQFNRTGAETVLASELRDDYKALETRYDETFDARRQASLQLLALRGGDDAVALTAARDEYRASNAALKDIRAHGAEMIKKAGDEHYNDTNYIFPTFVITHLPIGITGLVIAVIFAAAMSSMDSELNSLATTTVIDIYKRHVEPDANERHYLMVARVATLVWGVLAGCFALYAGELGSVIEAVNMIGSYFYGSLLGVFVLAVCFRRANGHGATVGMIAGMLTVAIASRADLAFLWLNPLGCFVVVIVGLLVSLGTTAPTGPAPDAVDLVGKTGR